MGKDVNRARALIEFQLGNCLHVLLDNPEDIDEETRRTYAGKVAALDEALGMLSAAEKGRSVNDLDIGAQTVAEFRERAREHHERRP